MQVPLWAFLISSAAAVVGPFVSNILTNRNNAQSDKRRIEQEHRQWLRGQQADAYLATIDYLQRYWDWHVRLKGMRDTSDKLRHLEYMDELEDLHRDGTRIKAVATVYASPSVDKLLSRMFAIHSQLQAADLKMLLHEEKADTEVTTEYQGHFLAMIAILREDLRLQPK